MADNNYTAKIIRLGIPDRFIEQGSIKELQTECGYNVEGIVKTIQKELLK